jgi:hypothetical protein
MRLGKGSHRRNRAGGDSTPVRLPAEPLDVPRHDLGDHTLKFQQILGGM